MKRLLIPNTQIESIRRKSYDAWYILDCPVEWRWFRPYEAHRNEYLDEGVSAFRYREASTVIIEDPKK